MVFESPVELKALRQWVIWRYEVRPGKDKSAKVPYQPRTGHRARTDVPATWGTWDEVGLGQVTETLVVQVPTI